MRALGGGGHLGVFLGHAANLRGTLVPACKAALLESHFGMGILL